MSLVVLKRIYLGKQTTFASGTPVEIVDFSNGATIRDEFYVKVTKKSPKQIQGYRAKLIFSGNGSAPLELSGADQIKAWVAEKPGRIGYIDSSDADASIKVLLSID